MVRAFDGRGAVLASFDQEVDDDLRAQRAVALARRLAPVIAAAIVLLLAGIGLWQYLRHRAEQRAEAASAAYFAADQLAQKASPGGVLDRAAAGKARDAFAAVARDAPDGIAVLARLHVAGLAAQLGDLAAAHAEWVRVEADDAAPAAQRSLATLLDCSSRIGTDPVPALKARLAPLEAPGAPWRALAQEAEALADLGAGDQAAARALLTQVSMSADAPQGARQRAQGLLQTLPAPAASADDNHAKTTTGGKAG